MSQHDIEQTKRQNKVEHLAWAKKRALLYIEREGDVDNAWASFTSDMNKHPDLRLHSELRLGFSLKMNGHLKDAAKMKKFIEGFNA